MIKQTVLVMGVSTFLTTMNVANADSYIEQDGRLIVEVEAGAAGGNWSMQNSIPGHTGAGYLVWDGPNNYAESEAPRGNPIQYTFRVTTPGNYQLRWRSRNTEGNDPTEHNDSWVRFPTGENIDGQHFLSGWTKVYMGHVQQWTWDSHTVDSNNQPIRQYFDAGEHVIEIAGRSNGHGLDRFALFQYEQEDFNVALFESLPQSPKSSTLGVASHSISANSCDADTLSVSADTVMIDTAIAGGDIAIGDQQNAMLRFNVPSLSSNNVTLKLSSSQPSLNLSAYLGSHSNWDTNTAPDDLPYAATLLGSFNAGTVKDQIQSLAIDSSLLSAGTSTIILRAESANSQQLHGLATTLEPRLNITGSDNFCADLQDTDSEPVTNTPDEPQQPEQIPPTTPVVTDTPATPDTTDQNAPVSTPVLVEGADTNPSQSPFEVVDQRTPENGDDSDATPAKKSGGAVSVWILLLMTLTAVSGRFRNRR